MTPDQTLRARRVAHSIKRVATDFLSREVSDPALSALSVTDVELTGDLGIATVKVRLFVGGDDRKRRRSVMKSLSRSQGRLRKTLGSALSMKRVPVVRFAYDVGADAADRVEQLLSEIADDKTRAP